MGRILPQTVYIGAGKQDSGLYKSTKSIIDRDGLSTIWETSDVLYLWAKGDGSGFALDAQPFTAYGIDGGTGVFKSTLAAAMQEGIYEYFACYPRPASTSGTVLSFTVSSTQSGNGSDGNDVLVSYPVSHDALYTSDPSSMDGALQLRMKHLTHVLNFYLLDENNILEGESVKRISATFPGSVTGSVSIDIADPSKVSYTTDAEHGIMLNLEDPLLKSDATSRHYASANILPHTYGVDEFLNITLYTENKMATVAPIALNGRSFEAGHATPVQIVPESAVETMTAHFTIASNNLGEDVTTIRITGPESCKFGDGGSNSYEITDVRGFKIGDNISITYTSTEDFATLSDMTVDVEFESEHAIVRSKAQIPAITANTVETGLNVPYLYFEDFSSTTMTNEYRSVVSTSSNSNGGNSSGGSNTSTNLSSYGWPTGWNGTRCGISAGDKIRLTARSEYYAGFLIGIGAYSRSYNGRIDTPALGGIKDGKEVRIKLEFDYASGWEGSDTNASDFCLAVGTHKTAGSVNAKGGSNTVGRSLADESIISDDLSFAPDNKIANNVYPSETKHYVCESTQSCDSNSRIAFETYLSTYSGDGRYNYWLFLDNIKISILSD